MQNRTTALIAAALLCVACGPDEPSETSQPESSTGMTDQDGSGTTMGGGSGSGSLPSDSSSTTDGASSSDEGSSGYSSTGPGESSSGSTTGGMGCDYHPFLGCVCDGMQVDPTIDENNQCWCGEPGEIEIPGEECQATMDSGSSDTGPFECVFFPGAGCICDGMISSWYECFVVECVFVEAQCFCEGVPMDDVACTP